jgi:hypothetical protein
MHKGTGFQEIHFSKLLQLLWIICCFGVIVFLQVWGRRPSRWPMDKGLAKSNRAHSYLDCVDGVCHHPIKNDDTIYATFAAPANKKLKKDKCSTKSKCSNM